MAKLQKLSQIFYLQPEKLKSVVIIEMPENLIQIIYLKTGQKTPKRKRLKRFLERVFIKSGNYFPIGRSELHRLLNKKKIEYHFQPVQMQLFDLQTSINFKISKI